MVRDVFTAKEQMERIERDMLTGFDGIACFVLWSVFFAKMVR